MKLKLFSLIPVIILTCSCEPGCPQRGPGAAVPVTVEPVKMQESSPTVIVPGILIPKERVDIKAPAGGRVSEVYVKKGDMVSQGALLAKLSEEDINIKLGQLRAAQREAEALAEKNSFLFKNRDRLLEEGKIDKTQYDGLETESSANEAILSRIKTDIAAAEYSAAQTKIISPINGIVIGQNVTPGETPISGQILFTIVNTNPVLVSFSLTAEESAGIKTGLPLTVKIEDMQGEDYNAQITYIGPEIQQPGKAFDVWAEISNPDRVLKAGMRAVAAFTSMRTHKVFVVPDSALITRNYERYLFTVSEGVAHLTKVRVRNIYNGIAEVSEGLQEGDLIAIKGVSGLQDGTAVDIWRR